MFITHEDHKKRLIVASVLSTTLMLLAGCNKEEDAKTHLQKGVEYLNKGDLAKAKLELKTSNQADKDTADTYYYLALLDEKNRNYKAMKENLQKAVELAPTRTEARIRLARVLILLNEVDAANEHVKILLKDSAQNPDVQALKATVLIRQQHEQEALDIIGNILKANPNHPDALALKSLIYMQKGEYDEALKLIDAAIKSDPKNIPMHLFKVQLHEKTKNEKAIIEDLQALIALYPDAREFKIILVKVYSKYGKGKEAEELLRKVVAEAPDDILPQLLLLDYLASLHDQERLMAQFHQFTEQHKDKAAMLLDLADWMNKRKNYEEANVVLNRVMELEDKESELAQAAKVKLARNAFESKDFDNADKILVELLEVNPNYDDARLVQARILLAKKQYDDAIELLNKINWSKPNSDEVHALLAMAYLDKKDDVQARKFFARALELNPANLDAFVYIYQQAINEKQLAYAKEVLEKTLRFMPDNLVLLQQLARINLSNKDWNGARMVSEAIANVDNPLSKDLATHLQAQILQGQGEYAKAIEIYKELAVKYPENRDAIAGMAFCYEQLKKRDEMIGYLNGVLAKYPKNVAAGVLLGDLYILDKKYDKASTLLTNVTHYAPNNAQAFTLLASAKLAQNDGKGAVDTLEEGRKQNPMDINISMTLASLYESQGNFDAASGVYEALIDHYPDLDVAINNLATLLTDRYTAKDKLDKAVALAKKFKDSDQPFYMDTYAWALVKQGAINDGIGMLNKVVAKAPEVSVFKYHLGFAHYKNGDNQAAVSELKQAIDLAKKKGSLDDQKAAETLMQEIASKK